MSHHWYITSYNKWKLGRILCSKQCYTNFLVSYFFYIFQSSGFLFFPYSGFDILTQLNKRAPNIAKFTLAMRVLIWPQFLAQLHWKLSCNQTKKSSCHVEMCSKNCAKISTSSLHRSFSCFLCHFSSTCSEDISPFYLRRSLFRTFIFYKCRYLWLKLPCTVRKAEIIYVAGLLSFWKVRNKYR